MINYTVDLLRKVQNDFKEFGSQIDNKSRQIFSVCEKAVYSLEQEIKVAEQQMAMLNSEMTAVNQVIRMNNDTKARARQQIASARKDISNLKNQISSLKSQISSAEDSNTKSQLKSQKSSLEDQVESLNKLIAECEKKIQKVDENYHRLTAIRGDISEKLQKCFDHKQELEFGKSEMDAAYKTFKDSVYPRVMSAIHNDIIPKMEETIRIGTQLANSLLILANREGYGIYSAEVNIDSAASFQVMATRMKKSLDELKNYTNRCRSSTRSFSHNLNDRVSQYASTIVDSTTGNIETITYNHFDSAIEKMHNVYQIGKEYENIDIYVGI